MANTKFPQNIVDSTAKVVQQAAQLFEIVADDCKYANGFGGCKKLTTDGPAEACAPLSCPLGGE